MFKQIAFYLRYAARNLARSARWTAFAVFCIAAGVAAVVALRSLGLAIGDSLLENARAQNHGDIRLQFGASGGFSFGVSTDEGSSFSAAQLAQVSTWAAENGAQWTAYIDQGNAQITRVDQVSAGRPQFVSLLLIDPASFPPTDPVRLLQPAGARLNDAFGAAHSIVISQNLATQQGIAVGDSVRVSGTEQPFTVTGIAPTEAEAGIGNLFAAFFGFAYLPLSDAAIINLPDPQPNSVALTLPAGSSAERIDQAAAELFRAVAAGTADSRSVNLPSYTTITELIDRNTTISDILGRFIVVMGLGSLLIGGVGIINTMLVLVGRRTAEIAALKTFGLKGRQVAAMFLSEALLLGVMGSIVGVALGLLLSGVVNQYGEAFLQQRLPVRLYPEAVLFGLALGLVVTLVFGVLPVLTAIKVRPAIILRPNETALPAAGCLTSGFTLLLVIVIIGGIAGRILGSIPAGILGVALTLLVLGVLVGLMWVVVWIVSRLPAFGSADLRLALRNLTSRRIRTATTLLALAAGMFALSSITFVGAGTRELLNVQLTQQFGGNVLVFPLLSFVSPALAQGTLNAQINQLQGVEYVTRTLTYSGGLELVNGQAPPQLSFGDMMDDAPPRAQRVLGSIQLQVRETTNPNPPSWPVSAGRTLTAEDNGRMVMLASDDFASQQRGITLGSSVVVRVGDQRYEFEVVGILSGGGLFSGFGQYVVPMQTLSGTPDFALTTLQVAPDNLNQVLLDLSVNPLVISLDVSFIDALLSRLINQFSALPTVVGLLSLLAAAVAMANTVSLATLERRRQIGILKAVGLKGRRVLWIMLLENSVIGLLGGLLGIGLSALGVATVTALGQGQAIPIPREAAPVAIALLFASLLIAWAATFLSAHPATRERVTNVLRYE